MDDPQLFQVTQCRQQLYCKSADQTVVETLIVVHFDELVEVYRVKVKHKTQVVAPDEVVNELDYPLYIIAVVLFKQQKQLCLHSCLVVVLLLVFDHLDCNFDLVLVVKAFNHASECTFADLLYNLVPVADLVTCLQSIVAFLVIKPVVYETLKLGRLVLLFFCGNVPNLLKLLNFSALIGGQVVFWKEVFDVTSFARKLRIRCYLV